MRRIPVLLLILLFLLPVPAAEGTEGLSVDTGRDLDILIIADTQDTASPQRAMLDLIDAALERCAPDLVILLGDNIHGPSVHGIEEMEKAVGAVLEPIVSRGIPFALVFGNHDEECGISNEEQLRFYRTFPGCLTTDAEDLPGCGNSFLVVENKAHPDSPAVLFFLDSGNKSPDGAGYGSVSAEQSLWMAGEFQRIREEHPGAVPYVFQHIPVPRVYDLLESVPFGTPGAFTQYGKGLFRWYRVREGALRAGRFGEAPCASEYDTGEFEVWTQMGVRAAFFGHDHLNDYEGTVEGVDLIATAGAGFYMYGRGDEHGVRLLTLKAEDVADYTTGMLYYRDLVSAPLPGPLVSTVGVLIRNVLLSSLAGILLLTAGIVLLLRAKKRKKRPKR